MEMTCTLQKIISNDEWLIIGLSAWDVDQRFILIKDSIWYTIYFFKQNPLQNFSYKTSVHLYGVLDPQKLEQGPMPEALGGVIFYMT